MKEFGKTYFLNSVYISFYNNRRIASIFEQDYSVPRIIQALEIELHVKIDPQNTESEEPEVSDIDFDAYALEADRKNSAIAGLLEDNLFLLKDAQDKLNNARRMLPAMSAIDDPDMDPKNIMWHEDKAYVIDLECLERGNPIATCLNLALQWAGTVNGRYSKENP